MSAIERFHCILIMVRNWSTISLQRRSSTLIPRWNSQFLESLNYWLVTYVNNFILMSRKSPILSLLQPQIWSQFLLKWVLRVWVIPKLRNDQEGRHIWIKSTIFFHFDPPKRGYGSIFLGMRFLAIGKLLRSQWLI